VTDSLPPSALREIRDHLRQPFVLAALAGVTVILALSGPFRTLDLMAPLPRLGYWAAVVFGTYAIGTAVVAYLFCWTPFSRLPPTARVATGSPLLGAAVTLALLGLDAGLGLAPVVDWRAIAEQLAIATAISAVVLTLREIAQRPAIPATPAPRPATILDRLPLDRRGALLALSAEDHYVRVATRSGDTLVLLRLSDAMRETGDLPGLQVHRSHWVARNAVRAVRRSGDGAILTLVTGREVPVSRRFMPALRQAGLLPAPPRAPMEGTALAGMDHD
jgi:DNA-binding LytR/AlgR family response regulator